MQGDKELGQDILELYLEGTGDEQLIVLRLILTGDYPAIITHKAPFNSSIYNDIISELTFYRINKQAILTQLKKVGAMLHSFLLFDNNGNLYSGFEYLFLRSNRLVIFADNVLCNLPFEFIYNGNLFLSQFRVVTRSIDFVSPKSKFKQGSVSMIIITDPVSSSKRLYNEGYTIFTSLEELGFNIDFISKPFTRLEFVDILEAYDIVHFVGHGSNFISGNAGGGIVIGDDTLMGGDIKTLSMPPVLVFLNSCSAGVVSDNLEDSITVKLLKLGVMNVISSVWFVPDGDFSAFTILFYKLYLSGAKVGNSFYEALDRSFNKDDFKSGLFSLYGVPKRF